MQIELEDGGKQREMEGRVNFLNRKERRLEPKNPQA